MPLGLRPPPPVRLQSRLRLAQRNGRRRPSVRPRTYISLNSARRLPRPGTRRRFHGRSSVVLYGDDGRENATHSLPGEYESSADVIPGHDCLFARRFDYELHVELLLLYGCVKVKAAHTRITGRRVPELIPVLGSQPAGDVSHKPGGRLPLLSARPAVTRATLNRAATSFAAW